MGNDVEKKCKKGEKGKIAERVKKKIDEIVTGGPDKRKRKAEEKAGAGFEILRIGSTAERITNYDGVEGEEIKGICEEIREKRKGATKGSGGSVPLEAKTREVCLSHLGKGKGGERRGGK